MKRKTPEEKVNDAFDSATLTGFGLKYLELLYGNWADMMRALRRTILLAVILVASFLLLSDAKSASFTIGPLKTSNIAAVLTLIPAITSFLTFEAIDLTLSGAYYREVSSALWERLYRPIFENNLEVLLEPMTTFAWGMGTSMGLSSQKSKRIESLVDASGIAMAVVTVLGILAFLVYAYWRLYEHSHTSWIVVTGSLAFAIFTAIRSSLLLYDALVN